MQILLYFALTLSNRLICFNLSFEQNFWETFKQLNARKANLFGIHCNAFRSRETLVAARPFPMMLMVVANASQTINPQLAL